MNVFGVREEKAAALARRMARLGIRESDIEESFIRSSGPGGQRLNKAATGVYLKHLPSGLEVKCMRSRSQALNRYHARVMLAGRMEAIALGRRAEAARERDRIRRQKKRRSRRARRQVRVEKEQRSARKKARAPLRPPED